MRLCTKCAALDIRQLRADRLATYVSIDSRWTKEAAKKGCQFCALLLESATAIYEVHRDRLKATDPNNAEDADLFTEFPWLLIGSPAEKPFVWWKKRVPPRYRKLNVTLSKYHFRLEHSGDSGQVTQENVDFEICLAAAPDSPAYKRKVIGGRFLGDTRDCPEFYNALREWLKTCLESSNSGHELCCKSMSRLSTLDPSDSPLPTRCLEITDNRVRLAETLGQRGKYVTLSHRWHPNTSSYNTNTANYNRRLNEGIGELSFNFQDAITLCRELGIRYLWIDSICIIQAGDGGADWDEESKKMGSYYQNSILTIFAVSGAQDRGFLQMKADLIDHIVQLPFFKRGHMADKKVQHGHFYAFRRPMKSDNIFLNEVDRGELLSRGWVFQEHLLSRRIVYFTEQETFVECASRSPMSLSGDPIQVGDGVTRRPRQRSDFNFRTKKVRARLNHSFKKDIMHESGNPYTGAFYYPWILIVCDNWYNIVMDYSSTALTFHSDHLRAISGIAIEVGNVLKQQRGIKYVSGLWLNDIHRGLLWRSRAPQAVGCTCGAPSWSWLALSSPVQWSWRHDDTIKELQVLKFSPELPKEFNPVWMSKGMLVRACLMEVVVKGPDDNPVDDEGKPREQRYKTNAIRQKTGDIDREPDSKLFSRIGPNSRRDAGVFYGVFSKSEPDIVAGWASIDEPQYYSSDSDPHGYAGTVIACHIETRRNIRQSNMSRLRLPDRASNFGFLNKVYDVLFLKQVGILGHDSYSYQRIGMGSIYGRTMQNEFDAEVADIFELV